MSTATTQVQFFEADYIAKLQSQINEFLETKEGYNILDIKYNHYHDPEMGERNNIWYTAMVIYHRDPVPEAKEKPGTTTVFTSR